MRRIISVAIALAALLTIGLASTARGAPGPIQLVSSNGIEQADEASSPALSADGRYVAFSAQISGLVGIFRKDLSTGELAPVLVGPAGVYPELIVSEPSISADGRYVSFTTTDPLDPDDDPQPNTSDVYVADMATAPPTYELASALDGCNPLDPAPHTPCGLRYEANAGSVATGRVALSADGRRVVFVTATGSNLTEPDAAPETFPTPAYQVAVRNLETDETTLISAALDPLTGEPQPDAPVPGGAVIASPAIKPAAAISADGSTVAWLGQHLRAQVQVSEPEAASIARLEGLQANYDEPLWRRAPTSPEDPAPDTRRIVTGKDFPRIVSGANGLGVNQECALAAGWNLARGEQLVPVLSGNGNEVALIGQPESYSEAFLADMSTPIPSVKPLTHSPPLPLEDGCAALATPGFFAADAVITSIAIAPEGERIAFTTKRQRFPLTPPTLVTPPPTGIGLEELYLIDLGASSLERLTHGDTASEPSLGEEGQSSTGAAAVSFDADGETVAFSDQAYNLVPGDGNGANNGAVGGKNGSDVFVVSDPRPTTAPGASRISAPPVARRPTGRWLMTARASSRPDGSVRVAVGVPGPGKLAAVARATGSKRSASRKVAAARRRARLASVLIFILRPRHGFNARVHQPGGLEAALRLHFAGQGGKPLTKVLHVRFRFHRRPTKAHAR